MVSPTVGEILDALAEYPRDAVLVTPAPGPLGVYSGLVHGRIRGLIVYPHAAGRHLFTTDPDRSADLLREPIQAVEIS
jgi:hypothetical protein